MKDCLKSTLFQWIRIAFWDLLILGATQLPWFFFFFFFIGLRSRLFFTGKTPLWPFLQGYQGKFFIESSLEVFFIFIFIFGLLLTCKKILSIRLPIRPSQPSIFLVRGSQYSFDLFWVFVKHKLQIIKCLLHRDELHWSGFIFLSRFTCTDCWLARSWFHTH